MTDEPLLREEQDAVSSYFGIHVSIASTPTRAIIHHEVFHSSSYKQKGSTCSSLVEVVDNMGTIYGEIIKFISHDFKAIAIIKVMHPHRQYICKNSSLPSQPFLRHLSQQCQLANFYLPVEKLDELVAVKCSSITRKCIYISAGDFHESVVGFLVPVVRDYRV